MSDTCVRNLRLSWVELGHKLINLSAASFWPKRLSWRIGPIRFMKIYKHFNFRCFTALAYTDCGIKSLPPVDELIRFLAKLDQGQGSRIRQNIDVKQRMRRNHMTVHGLKLSSFCLLFIYTLFLYLHVLFCFLNKVWRYIRNLETWTIARHL